MTEEAAQPEAVPEVAAADGQGVESGEGNDIYASFLDGVPEDIHDQVIPALKAQDAEFTKRFQSRSERVKPFEDLGILDQEPEAIGQYVQLDQMMAAAQQGDEEAIEAVYKWWDQVGEGLNFYEGDGDDGEPAEDEGEFDVLDMDKQKFDSAVQAKVEEIVGPMAQQLQSREQQEQEAAEFEAANAQIEEWVSEVKEANPSVFNGEDGDQVLDDVLEMAELFVDQDNPVAAGFEKYQSLVSKGESGLFEQKQNQPQVPEGAGRANTSPPVPTMKNAKELALQYVSNGKANQ